MEEDEKGDQSRPDHKNYNINNNNNSNNNNEERKKMEEERQTQTQTQTQTQSRRASNPIAKSCKGCLYYSSSLKSNSRNPRCVGITRSLPEVPRYIVGQSELEASKEGRNLSEFKYGCVGFSVYLDGKSSTKNPEEGRAELPACLGIELLMDKVTPGTKHPPAHVRSGEDGRRYPWTSTQKPAHHEESEFLTRFTRSASLVAFGVAENMRRMGKYFKANVDDILDILYRRPK